MGSSCGRVPEMGRGPAGATERVHRGPLAAPSPPGPWLLHLSPNLPLPHPLPPPQQKQGGWLGGARSGRGIQPGCALGPALGLDPTSSRAAVPLPTRDPVTPPTVLQAGATSGSWSVPGIDCPPVTGSALGKFQKAPGSNLSGQRGHQGWASASQKTPDPPVELARVPRAFPPSAQPASEDPGRSQPPCHTTGGPWWGPACDTQGVATSCFITAALRVWLYGPGGPPPPGTRNVGSPSAHPGSEAGSPLEMGGGPCSAAASSLPSPRHVTCRREPRVFIFENGGRGVPGTQGLRLCGGWGLLPWDPIFTELRGLGGRCR